MLLEIKENQKLKAISVHNTALQTLKCNLSFGCKIDSI